MPNNLHTHAMLHTDCCFDEYKYDPFFNINKYDDLIEAEKIENYFFKK